MTYSPSPPGGRCGSSISPVISSFVLAPEEPRQFRRYGYGTAWKSKPKEPSPGPLIHKYRHASAETPILRRHPSTRTKRVPRSVSFDMPARRRFSTTTESDVKLSTITSSDSKPDRSREYCVFLVSMTAATFTITVLQPFVLYQYVSPCYMPRCYRPALAIRGSIQPSIAPCYDFFMYSCSGAGSAKYAKIYETLMFSVLHSISAMPTGPGQSSVQKAGIVLRNCMKLADQQPEELDKIKGVLDAGGFTFPEMKPTSVFFVVRGIVEINLDLGIGPLFRLTVGHNLRLRRGYMLYFAPSYHIVPFVRFLYQLQVGRKLEEYVRRCAEVIGEHGMSYMRVIKAVETVNRKFYRLPEIEPADAQVKLSTEYPDTEFWFTISEVLSRKLRSLPYSHTTFLVLDGEYANFISQNVFMTLDPTMISAYVGLYIVWLLSRLASYNIAYGTPIANNTNSLKDLWPRCFSDIYQLMPFAAERLFLSTNVDATDTEHLVDMVERITHSARNFVTSLHNPTEESELRMTRKIANLRLLPYTFAALHDVVEVDRLYLYVPDQDDVIYVESYLSLCRVTSKYMVSLLLETTANTSKFFVPPFRTGLPFMVSVYNVIHLGPDTVVPPLDKSFSLNYAGIGHKVVQQVSQLFLYGPDIFNETGSYDRVWSSDFFNALRKKYQCLRQQYVNHRWYDGEISRRILETAVTTDILFNAYKGVRKERQHSAHFRQEREQFGLTPEQLFFVGLCINWYQRNHWYRGLTIRTCRLSLPSLRGFSDAFVCPRTTPQPFAWDGCAN